MHIKHIIFSLIVLSGASCWSTAHNPNDTLALEAAKKNDLSELIQALEKGANIDATDDNGSTALIWAARYGYGKIVATLIEKKARVNIINKNGYTAFMWAVGNRHIKIIATLFKKMTPTQIIRDISVIIRKNIVSLSILTSILTLVAYTLNGMLTDLQLRHHQDTVNEEFHHAVRNHDINGLAQTLERGANIHSIDPLNLEADVWGVRRARNLEPEALALAIHNGRADILTELLERRANVNARIQGRCSTPIVVATNNGHEAIVNLLIQAGANVDTNDIRNRHTALMRAAIYGHAAIANQLIQARANVNEATGDGHTALIYAAQDGHEAIVNQLLQAGANINAATRDGRTALSAAFRRQHLAIINLLLEAGAQMAAGADSNMALKQAIDRNQHRLVELLLQHNADTTDLTQEQEQRLERWGLQIGG